MIYIAGASSHAPVSPDQALEGEQDLTYATAVDPNPLPACFAQPQPRHHPLLSQ